MTAFWTYENLSRVTGGTWRNPPDDGRAILPAARRDDGPVLWHDTRELVPGQCYLAIQGDNFDGHDFVEDAFEKGASMAIVNRGATQPAQQAVCESQPILEVKDTVAALQDLARAYRDELSSGGCKVIGVAGSNGKTTTRHLIHHVLTYAGQRGTQSPKSFNNHLGVPLTLLAARPTDDFVACEIGTNHPGEIDSLSAIARPDIAVITSIGEEHLEFFGDIEGVAEEESSILRHVSRDGVVMTPGYWDEWITGALDAEYLKDLPATIKSVRVGQQPEAVDARIDEVYVPELSSTNTAPQPLAVHHGQPGGEAACLGIGKLGLSGWHNCANATFAFAVACEFGLSFEEVSLGWATATPPGGRGETLRFQDCVLIHDAYNANPQSVNHAINLLAYWDGTKSSRKVIVLGDMYELGDDAGDYHERVIDYLSTYDPTEAFVGGRPRRSAIDQVVLIGPGMCGASAPLRRRWAQSGRGHLSEYSQWTDDLPEKVAALLQPGDTVLLKGSRGMRLERLIPAIEERFGKAEAPQPVSDM